MHRSEVEEAAKAGIDEAKHEGRSDIGGSEGRKRLACQKRIDEDTGKAADELHGRVLEAADVGDLLREDDHEGIHGRGHEAADKAEQRERALKSLADDEEASADDSGKAGKLAGAEMHMEEDWREGHDNDRAAIVEKGRDADADQTVGLEEEDPAAAKCCSRKGKEERLLRVCGTLERLMAAEKAGCEYDGEEEAAEERAHEHDLGGRKEHLCRYNAIGAKEKQRCEIAEQGFPHGCTFPDDCRATHFPRALLTIKANMINMLYYEL